MKIGCMLLLASMLGLSTAHKPRRSQLPEMARWLMHESTWGVMSTVSTDPDIYGAAFGNPQNLPLVLFNGSEFCKEFVDSSISEGPLSKGNFTGLPYFYVSEMDVSQIDAQANNIVSFTVSEAQSPGGCMNTDPESPLCVRLTLTGQLVEVTDEDERDFAIKALFQRHPAMKGWPDDHDWKVKKLMPTHCSILDMFGGPKPLSVEDYLAVEL